MENFFFENKNENFNENLSVLNKYENQGFKLEVVKDFDQLKRIGNFLDNCAGSFDNMDGYKEKINILVKSDSDAYLIGIKNGNLCQFKGFKNKSPSKELFNSVCLFLSSNNFIEIKDLDELYKKEAVHR